MFPVERTTGLRQGVVAGFDGTHRSRVAVRWAAEEAVARRTPLHVVRVVEYAAFTVAAGWVPVSTGPDETRRRQLADEVAAEVDDCRDRNPGLEVHGAVHEGSPCVRLAEHADVVGADTLAVGASHLGPVARLLFGSTEAGLLRATRQPLIVVRDLSPVQEAYLATGYLPVVAVLDDAATAPPVLRFGYAAAARRGAPLRVLHVATEVPAETLDGLLARVRGLCPGLTVHAEAVEERVERAVLGSSEDARLVVMGHRKTSVLRRPLSHTVLHHAGCSVALVSEED